MQKTGEKETIPAGPPASVSLRCDRWQRASQPHLAASGNYNFRKTDGPSVRKREKECLYESSYDVTDRLCRLEAAGVS